MPTRNDCMCKYTLEKDAYKGGATPDWTSPDPAITGKAAKVIGYGLTGK